jgi:transcriptional pleiotropic regulator of transition state genes
MKKSRRSGITARGRVWPPTPRFRLKKRRSGCKPVGMLRVSSDWCSDWRRMREGGMVVLRAMGVVRQVDGLGRVVIPKEIRTSLEYREGQPLEFFVQENGDVVLRKYERGCTFCGNAEGVKEFRQKLVCATCVAEMK